MLEPYGDLAVEALQIALDTLFREEKLFKRFSVQQLLWGKITDAIITDAIITDAIITDAY